MTLVYKTKIKKLIDNVDLVSKIQSSISQKKSYTLECPDDWKDDYKQYVNKLYNEIWNERGAVIEFKDNLVHISIL